MPPAIYPLHQIALRAAQALPRGASAVAVTGSVARGNWHQGSDVDLWVLGSRNARTHTYVQGHPVTYLMETLPVARSFLRMCRCEVPDIWVLRDPAGHFAAIKDRAIRERSRVRRVVTRATLSVCRNAMARGSRGNPTQQICWLREAAWRAAALEGWQGRGWHSAKFRHLENVLAPTAVLQLRKVMGVPLAPEVWTRLRREWPPFVRALARRRRPLSLPPVLEDPGYLFAQAQGGLPVDVVLEARQALRTHLPTSVWIALQDGRTPPRIRPNLPEGLAAVWAALHGFSASGPGDRDVIKVRAALAVLLPRLPASRHLLSRIHAIESRIRRTPIGVDVGLDLARSTGSGSRACRGSPAAENRTDLHSVFPARTKVRPYKPLEISMKSKPVSSSAKKSVNVNDLKTKRNPKGGFTVGMAVVRPAEFMKVGKRLGPK